MKEYIEDTIVAIGTRPGEAAIGIVKLSGRESVNIADKIFRSKNGRKIFEQDTFSMVYGWIEDSAKNIVDEAIVTIMRAPASYTREDIIEINCHGGIVATSKVMELCIEAGARIAEPGEFTKRAFINGRIDLSQAEAVIDIINAKTEQSLKIAAKNLSGDIKEKMSKIKESVLEVLVQLEAAVDFIEEDLETTPYGKLREDIRKIYDEIKQLIKDEEKGEIIKNGIKAAIVGKTNVGKSSLLNLLSNKEKAIVTEIPGTTRDAIEEILYIEGIPLILIDTAGIRDTNDRIEKIGVEKSLKQIDDAELVIIVLDGSREFDDIDKKIIKKIEEKKTICCINKKDIRQKINIDNIVGHFPTENIIKISALKGYGVKELEERIKKMILDNGESGIEEKIIVNARHKNILKQIRNMLKKALEAMEINLSEEFPSSDLRIAYDLIGEITGETARDDILDRVFSRFCIGK
ncbi:MAG: tRNA uridine-5-carboxymethylaminomethyl(34) synthesis GTPase MnmE [Actinomycetota bacterium]|nr:MAG: tRNA uridine-5-carboxymethylaminomethyl(34) synthesis GTPase MnmE [Actinomycetota bacterium]